MSGQLREETLVVQGPHPQGAPSLGDVETFECNPAEGRSHGQCELPGRWFEALLPNTSRRSLGRPTAGSASASSPAPNIAAGRFEHLRRPQPCSPLSCFDPSDARLCSGNVTASRRLLVNCLVFSAVLVQPAATLAPIRGDVRLRAGANLSSNWAGYVVPTSIAATSVQATWRIPSVNCVVAPDGESNAWVGVGGRAGTEPTFPQAGTDSNCHRGVAAYDLWCSHASFPTYRSVFPNNVVRAHVWWGKQHWHCSVTDLTTHHTSSALFNYTYKGPPDQIDFVVERQTRQGGGLAALADFKAVTYSGVSTAPAVSTTNTSNLVTMAQDPESSAPSILATSTVNPLTVRFVSAGPGSDIWRFSTVGAVWSSATIVGNTVYFGSNEATSDSGGDVYALNAETGELLWRFQTATSAASNSVVSKPTVSNGDLYVSSDNGYLYALDATTGAELWADDLGGGEAGFLDVSSPTVVSGVVYMGSDDGYIYAFNAKSGSIIWSYFVGYNVDSSPAVVNGIVYIGDGPGDVFALAAPTGALIWKFATGSDVACLPVVASGVVYVDSANGPLFALSAATGAKLWSSSPGGAGTASSPVLANGMVYVAGSRGGVYAINAKTGRSLWRGAAGSPDNTPTVYDGRLYVGSFDDLVYALNSTTGAGLWTYATGNAVEATPTVRNQVLYVGSNDNHLYALKI